MTALQAQSAPEAAPRAASLSWLPALDGLRAIAALAVLVTHVGFRSGYTGGTDAGPFLARLEVGVALFFVLSGYLLYRPFARAAIQGRKGPNPLRYLWRRALRVLPAYWAMMLVALVALNHETLKNAGDWLIPLALLHVYEPLQIPLATEQTWSLCTEVAFYLALPLFALGGRALGGRTPGQRTNRQLAYVGLLGAVGLAWTVCAHTSWWPLNSMSPLWLPGYLAWFAVGMGLAIATATPDPTGRLRVALHALASAPATCWTIAALLFWIATTQIAGPLALFPAPSAGESVAKHVLYVAIAAFALLPLVADVEPQPLVRAVLANPVSRYLGKISYGIFLWHLVVLEAWMRFTDTPIFSGRFWSMLGVTLAGAIAAASLSYHLLEHPLQRLRRG